MSDFGVNDSLRAKFGNYFPKRLMTTSIHVFYPNFMQIGHWKWHFGGVSLDTLVDPSQGRKMAQQKTNFLSGKVVPLTKSSFFLSHFPPLTGVDQSVQRSVRSISYWSVQECRSYSWKPNFERSQITLYAEAQLLHTITRRLHCTLWWVISSALCCLMWTKCWIGSSTDDVANFSVIYPDIIFSTTYHWWLR